MLRELAGPGHVVVISTHDERLLPLATQVVELTARTIATQRPSESVALAAGEVLFRQGDPGDLVYVLESGEIDLFRELADGAEEPLARMTAGQYFGELAPMFGLRRSATARAATDAKLTGYSVAEFKERFGATEAAEAPSA